MYAGINTWTYMEVYSRNASYLEGDNKRKDWSHTPTHQLLPKIIKGDPCQSFSKYISQLLYCINISEIDSTFYNFPTKPFGIINIMFALRYLLWWQGFWKYQRSRIFLMIRYINRSFFYGKPCWFYNIFSHIHQGKNSLQFLSEATISNSIVKRAFSVCRWIFIKQDIMKIWLHNQCESQQRLD